MRSAIATINLDNLVHNYRLLCQRAGQAELMAVVKANAYGHDLNLVAPALFEAGCRHFAATDAEEGAALRELLADKHVSITLLGGVFDAQGAAIAQAHGLTPAIYDDDALQHLQTAGFNGRVWLKVDTGMQRLGAKDPKALVTKCKEAGIKLAGVMSHLACADEPSHPMNDEQSERFRTIQQGLPVMPASLLNSAGLIALPNDTAQFVRPGIALYGAEPVRDQPMGLKPVMRLTGRVLQTRRVLAGQSISYGASFVAPQDMMVAVVGMGYADGLPRHLSNRGQAASHEGHTRHRMPIVGKICMDYCMIDCSHTPLHTGNSVEFWGETLLANDVAELADTIAYTLFTGVGPRVKRMAVRA